MTQAALSNEPATPPLPFIDQPAPARAIEPPTTPVLIGRNESFEGLMSFRGSARVEGTFQGSLTGEGRIEIGEHARIEGSIEADEVHVAGRVSGEIIARVNIEILASAEIRGVLTTPRLDAHEGCEVRAHCRTDRSLKQPVPATGPAPRRKTAAAKRQDEQNQSPSSS